ncbi:MAG: PKD domain-containing protein, partial [Bacteroidales bacterium]|nr:PKD domain-containing protein [Bacteroidales bacterium]
MKTAKLLLIVFLLCVFNLNSRAQWSSDPSLNTSIVIATGEQAIPKIASSTSYPGISYISWFSSESGNYNVRLQKLDVYGNKLWADEGLLISNHTAMTWLTDWDMTIDGNDCAILTFQDIRTGSNNIFVYKISPDGAFLWGADGIQLSNSTAFDASPKVCVTATGNTIVAWAADDVVIRQKISSDGTLLWGNDGITLSGTNAFSWPQLLPVGNDDVIIKYFEDIGTFPSLDRNVYAQKFDANGADVWSQATVISDAGGISAWTQIFPFINDGSDGFYIAWHDDRDNNMLASIFVNHINSGGQVLFPSNGVEASIMGNRNHYYAQLALPQGSNDIFVYWNEMDGGQNDRGIYGQKMSSTGTIQWGNNGKVFIEISSTNVYPMNSRGTENDMIVIYEEYFDAMNTSVIAMRIDTAGSYIWSPEKITMSSVQSEKGHAEVNDYIFGQLIAVWDDGRNTSKDIYGQNIQLDGSLGSIPPLFNADFTVSDDSICKNETVQFTDNSFGNVISWNWSFEGGTPATSTSQNPSITYNTSGTFDVELIISDGTLIDTTLRTDYIFVYDVPVQANIPVGPTEVCQGISVEYTTNTVQYAETYQWEVNPSDAGLISGTDTIGLFEPSTTWTGSYSVKVRGQNECYDGAWSPDLNCMVNMTPQIFQLTGEGAYCEGEPGAELILDGSETGVDYELFVDGNTTGNIVAGTGSPISFGYQTDEGMYTAAGNTAFCNSNMSGTIWVHEIYIPEQAATPEGPESVCNNTTTEYSTAGAVNADTLIWILFPDDAGILSPNGTQLSIEWVITYSGTVFLSVQGENICGTGPVSGELQIEIHASPTPEISGDTFTCQYYQDIIYNTPNISGNFYNWEISGGEIITGINTNEISVNWGAPGQG